MVSKILGILNKQFVNLHQTALLLVGASFASQFLGLIRDRLLAHTFGASRTLDIYYAAFKVPDFIFVTIASLVSLTILIPFLTKLLAEGDMEATRRFMDSLISGFLLLMLLVTGAAFLLMPYLARFIAPGFSPAETSELVMLSRILLLSPLFLGLSNHLGSITQSFGRFFIYALTPILYNVGIIIGILALYPLLGVPGLVWGVVLGAILQSVVQLPAIAQLGLFPRISWRINFALIRDVVRVCIPRTISLSTTQLVIIVTTAIATTLAAGSVAVFNLAYNLQSALLIFGVSYSMAAFASQSKLFVSGNIQGFVDETAAAARHIIFWSLPGVALFIVLRAQVVRVILGSGRFDWTNTRLVAAALGLFVISVTAQGLVLLFVRAYFASGKTNKPLLINVFSSAVTILLAFLAVPFFESHQFFRNFIEALFRVSDVPGTSVLMLPLAFSVGAILNAALHWFYFERDFGSFSRSVTKTLAHAFGTAVIAGAAAYFALMGFGTMFDLNTFTGIFLQGLLAGITGIIAGVGALLLLRNPEIQELLSALPGKIASRRAIIPGPEETPTQL